MIKEKAYAKVNLFLNVTSKRLDGYHDLEMVMAAVDLHDVLTFKLDKTGHIEIVTNKPITCNVEDNIVYKLALHLKDEFNITKGCKITITKNIPLGGGLGGGSADAAATLRGLNRLWNLKLSLEDMAHIGVAFGADIPFCVFNRLAVARGVGEKLDFIKSKCKPYVLLVNPNIEVSTKEIFETVVEEDLIDRNPNEIIQAIQTNDITDLTTELFNYLEGLTFNKYDEIRQLKNKLIDLGLRGTLMSGSGSTVFSISNDKKELEKVAEEINNKYYMELSRLRS